MFSHVLTWQAIFIIIIIIIVQTRKWQALI